MMLRFHANQPTLQLRRLSLSTFLILLIIILITLLHSSCIDVSAQTSIQRAQSLLTPAADRSIWTFNPSSSLSSSSSSPHFSTFTPPSQPPPPPLSVYSSNFSVATFNGRNQFIDLYSSQQDGGSRSVTQLTGDTWSIASWIYIDSMTTTTSQGKSRILLSRSTSQVWQTNRALVITIAADGHLALSYFNDRNMNTITGYAGWGNTWIPPLRQWFHIGLVYNVSYFTFYIGGYQIGSAYSSVTLGGIFVGNETLSYSKVGMSDMTVFTKDTLPFQGSLYALGFFDFALSSDDMIALATPQTVQSLIAASTVTYAILSSTPPLPSDTNPLTSVLAPWKYYRATTIPSSTQISFATLTPDPTLIQFFGARNQWSISFYLRFNSLVPAPCTILYMKDGTINTRVFGLSFDTNWITITYGILPTPVLNNYHIISSLDGRWINALPSAPLLTDWVRITVTYNGILFGNSNGQLTAYLNDKLVSTQPIDLTDAGTTKNIYKTMLLGSDGTTTTGIDGSIFGFTMWQGVSLAQSDITLLLVPSIVEYINDAPATIAAGSTMRVTFTATLIQTNSSLIVRGGDGTSSLSVYQLLDFTLQPSYRVEFVIPSARTASTYTITFEAPIPDPTQHLPQSICIEVVDMTATGEGAAPAVMNIDLTVLTVRQLLETADWTLPLTAPFIGNDAGCILAPAPSGVMNESILTCAGGSNDYIDVMNSTQTKVIPWPGIDINPTAFSFAFWLNSNVDVNSGSFPIFFAMNTKSSVIVINIVIVDGYPTIAVRGPTTIFCWTSEPAVKIFQQQQWQHLVITFGSGGCSVFVDGNIGLATGTHTANWTSSFAMQPIASDLVYLSGYPSVTPFSASYASIHFWNRELSQREITFLAGNKPAALQIPTTRTRRIAVLGLPSASQLLLQSNFFHSFDRAPIETHGYLIPAPSGASGYHVVAFDGTQPYGFDFTATQDVALSYGAAAWRIFPQSDLWAGQDSITFTMWFQSQNILGTNMDEPLLYFGNYDNTIEIRPMEMRIMAKVNQTICLASPIASGVIPQMIPTCASCFTHITALLNMQMRTCSLYLNGRRVATGALNTAAVTPLLKPWTTFWAHTGSGQTTQQPTNPLKGMIAQFGYWKRALTGIEINRLANSPPLNVALPSNQQQTHMTAARTILANADYDFVPIRKYQSIVAASLIDVNQPNGLNVASYLGSNSFTDLNDISAVGTGLSYKFPYLLSSTISLSVWVNLPPRNSAGTITPCIFNTATSSQGEEISLRHIVTGTSGDIEFRITNGPLTICHLRLFNSTTTPSSTLSINQWMHLVATFDTRGVCSLYLNGALASSAQGDSNGIGSLNSAGFISIARTSTYLGTCQTADTFQFAGLVAQFTMWQRALDQAEIAVLYSQPPPSIARLLLPASSLTLLDSASTPPTPISEWLFPPSDVGLTNYNIAVLGGGGVTFTSTTTSPPVNLLRASDNPSTKQTMPLVWGGESFTLTMWLRSTNSTSILSTTDGFRLFECSSDSSFNGNGNGGGGVGGDGGGENFISIGIGTSWSFYFETSVTLINATSLIVPVTTNRLTAPPLTYPTNKIPQEWQHLAFVYDADSQLVMISHNGAIVKTASWHNSFHSAALRAVRQKCLLGGSRKQPASASASFETLDLQIQYFSYHNSALSPSQLVSLYRNRRSSLLPLPSSTEPLKTQQLLLASSLSTFQYLNGIAPSSSPRVPSLNGKILHFLGGLGNYLTLSSPLDTLSPPYRTLTPSALSNIRITGLSIAFWLRVPSTLSSPTHVLEWHLDTTTRFLLRILGMQYQVMMIRNSATWCTMLVQQVIVVDATLFHHHTFVFQPDNSIQYYLDGAFQPQTSSTGVCANLGANADSFSTLPWIDSSVTGKVFFGGGILVDGTSAYGLAGDVAMINIFSRALTTSEITVLFALVPDALTSSQIPSPTSFIPANSRDSAHYSWRFNLAPSRSLPQDITLDPAPSGVGSVGRIAGSKGQYMLLSNSSEPYYRDILSLQSGNYGFGVSMWVRFLSLNATGINGNNTVIVEFGTSSSFINSLVRLYILSEDGPSRLGTRLALYVTDSSGIAIYQMVTQSNTLRVNEWTHIVFAHTAISADSPYRAVIYINSALCTAQILDDTIPSADRIGVFGYDRALGEATLDAQVAELSVWQLSDDPNKMLFIPDVILDLYRTPPPQLAGALGSEIDRLFMSAVARYDCAPPPSSSSTSHLVYYTWVVDPDHTYCYFGPAVNESAPFLDLMNPFDNRRGPILPPILTTSSQVFGLMSSDTTRGLTFSIHFRLRTYPQTKMFLFSIGTQDTQKSLIQLTFTTQQSVQHTFLFVVYDTQGTLIVTGTAFVPWDQLPLNVNVHLALTFGTTSFAMYVNTIKMSSSVSGTLVPAIAREFAAFGRDVYNMTDTNFQGHLALFTVFARIISLEEIKQLAAYVPPAFIVSSTLTSQVDRTSYNRFAGWNQSVQVVSNVPLTCNARRPIQTQVVFSSPETNVDSLCYVPQLVNVTSMTNVTCYSPIEIITPQITTQLYTSSALDFSSSNTLLFSAPSRAIQNTWFSIITSLVILPAALPGDDLMPTQTVTISPPLHPTVYSYTATFSSYTSSAICNYWQSSSPLILSPTSFQTGPLSWGTRMNQFGIVPYLQPSFNMKFYNPAPPIQKIQVTGIMPPTQSVMTFTNGKVFSPATSQYGLTVSQLTTSVSLSLTLSPNVKLSYWTSVNVTITTLTTLTTAPLSISVARRATTTIYFQTEPFLLEYRVVVQATLPTPTSFISSLTVKFQKPRFPDYIGSISPGPFDLETSTYTLTANPSAYTALVMHFNILPGDTVTFASLKQQQPQVVTLSYPKTDLSIALSGSTQVQTLTITSVYEGTYTIQYINPLFELMGMSITSFEYSSPVTIPLPSLVLTPVFSSDIFDYTICTFDIATHVNFNFMTSALVSVNINSSSYPQSIGPGPVIFRWGVAYEKNVWTFQTQDGNYTLTIDATASSTIAVPFTQLAVFEQPQTVLDMTPAISLSTAFSYSITGPVHPALVSYTLLAACAEPCPVTLFVNGAKTKQLVDGGNQISLGTPQPGSVTLQLLSPNTSPFYQNYSIVLSVPKPQPCLITTCQNGGTCINSPSTTYNTPHTCYCTAAYEGALCEKASTAPYDPTYPTAVVFVSGATIADCLNLTLDGTDSYGLGPAILNPYYVWSLTSMKLAGMELVNTADPTYDATKAAATLLTLSPSMVSPSYILPATPIITLSGTQFLGNSAYTFGLRVGNMRETSSVTTSITLTKSQFPTYVWIPALGIRLPSRVTRPNVNVATNILTPSTCMAIPVNITRINYFWKITLVNISANASPNVLALNFVPQSARQFNSTLPGPLSIPANFFRVGYDYSISLSLSFIWNYQFPIAAASITLPIVPLASPITAKIFGSDRSRPIDMPFSITADQSFDPDYVTWQDTANVPIYSGLTFFWSCTLLSNGAACTFPKEVDVDLTQVRVDVPQGVMRVGVTYLWTVTAMSIIDLSKSASASIRVTGAYSTSALIKPPLVAILDAPLRISSDETLRLQTSVVTQTTTSPLDMVYSWSLVCISSSTPVTTLPSLYDSTNLGNAINSSSLVLLPNLLLVPGVYQFTILVTDPFNIIDAGTQTLASSSTSVSIIVNARPQAGDCTITPSSGIALMTIFALECHDWFEPQNANFAPFTYAISYRDTTTGATTYQQLTAASLSSQKSFLLPAGSLSLRTQVTDQVGATSNFDLTVDVISPTSSDFDFLAYIANLTYVQLPVIISAGDSVASISFIRQIADLVNTARVMSQYADDAMSQSKLLQFNIDLVSQYQIALTNVLQTAQSSLDTSTLNVITQSLVPLTKYAVQLPPIIITNLTNEVASILGSALSSNRIEPTSAVVALTQVNSNLMTDCSRLDDVTALAHESMRLRQIHAVVGESIELAAVNYYAYVERTLVAAGTEVHLPTGESVILTPTAMKNYILRLNQLNITTIDTGGATGAAEMDTRIVTFSSRWSSCRVPPGGVPSLSALTNIEITFPNGDVVDIPSLDTDIVFTIPISKNSTDSILENARSSLPCPEAPFDRETVANTSFTCQFWNVTTKSYSEQGCHRLGFTFLADGSTLLQCACSHLTEFAILYAEAQNQYNTDVCAIAYSNLGDPVYLAFLIIYCFVGLIALIQLIRMFRNHGLHHFIFITLEHALILAICIFRALNMAMYYTLYKDITISRQIILSSLPYLFYSWIFTLVITTWATIWYRSSRGERTTSPLESFKVEFLIVNVFITCAFLVIFGLMSQSTELHELRVLNRAGVALTCIVEMGFGIFLVIYGLLLVRALTEHFVSDYAKKLGAIAISFSIAFGISAAILAYSVAAEEDAFSRHSLEYNSIYFVLDIVGLLLVMFLFVNSVSSESDGGSQKSGSTHGSTNGSHTATSARSHHASRSNGPPSHHSPPGPSGTQHTQHQQNGNGHSNGTNSHYGHSHSEIQLVQTSTSRATEQQSSLASPSGSVNQISSSSRLPPPSQQRIEPPPQFFFGVPPSTDAESSITSPSGSVNQQSSSSRPPPPIPPKRIQPPPQQFFFGVPPSLEDEDELVTSPGDSPPTLGMRTLGDPADSSHSSAGNHQPQHEQQQHIDVNDIHTEQ